MKSRLIVLMCVLPVIAAEPAGFKYWSAAQLKGFQKSLAPKVNAQKIATERLADFGNHYAMVAHRAGSGEAEYHETEADFYVVASGSATLVVGGKIRDSKTTAPGEIRGPSIEGGTRQRIETGDVAHIPSKTPHQLLLARGAQLTYFILKVKE